MDDLVRTVVQKTNFWSAVLFIISFKPWINLQPLYCCMAPARSFAHSWLLQSVVFLTLLREKGVTSLCSWPSSCLWRNFRFKFESSNDYISSPFLLTIESPCIIRSAFSWTIAFSWGLNFHEVFDVRLFDLKIMSHSIRPWLFRFKYGYFIGPADVDSHTGTFLH